MKRLETIQTSMIRSILGIKKIDKIKIIDMYKKPKMENIIINVRRIKWKWAGHIARLKDERWTKLITEWQPIDKKRKRGMQN